MQRWTAAWKTNAVLVRQPQLGAEGAGLILLMDFVNIPLLTGFHTYMLDGAGFLPSIVVSPKDLVARDPETKWPDFMAVINGG